VAKSNSPKPAPKHAVERVTPIIGGLSLYYPILVDCNLDWPVAPENTENEKPERFYDAAIRISDGASKEAFIAVCSFSAGQKLKETKIFEIRATYLVAVGHSDGFDVLKAPDRKKLLSEVIECSAWPLYRALFVHMGSQTNLELPLLPNVPKLRWLKSDEEDK
jgi:hypothetical protein